jgi:hypothetical protein
MSESPPDRDRFEVWLPDGFDPGERRAELEAAAKQQGWKVETEGGSVVVRDVWTENDDHAAWLVASKVGLDLERVTVYLDESG